VQSAFARNAFDVEAQKGANTMARIPIPPREILLAYNRNLVVRFKDKIEFPDFRTNACWPWIGAHRNEDGKVAYGEFGIVLPNGARTPLKSHRLALVFQGEDVRPEFDVAHLCMNGLCMNPSHLVRLTAGTHRHVDAHRRMLQRLAGQQRDIIPRTMLWDGWDLPEYNRYAEAELGGVAELADQVALEIQADIQNGENL